MSAVPAIGLSLVVLFVALAFLGLLVWAAIALFRHGGPVVRVFVVLMGAIVLLVPSVAVLNTVREQRTSVARNAVTEEAVDFMPLPQASEAARPTATWRPAAEILPDATVDFYPSRREAERAVAEAIFNHGTTPVQLIPVDTAEPIRLQELADALTVRGLRCFVKQSDQEWRTGGVQNFDAIPPETRRLTVRLVEAAGDRGDQRIGRLTVRSVAETPGPQFVTSVRFIEKSWLTDLSAFRIASEAPQLVVGFSGTPESTEANAEDAALRAVAALLARRIADERSPGQSYHPSIMYPELGSIARNLRRAALVEDQFTQQLGRSYGTVFRHAVLVDATPDTIKRLYNGGNLTWVDLTPEQQLEQGFRDTSHAAAQHTASGVPADGGAPPEHHTPHSFAVLILRVFGLGVLIGVTLLIYRVLDHWTLGYRQGTLAMTAVAVILGGAALLGLLLVS